MHFRRTARSLSRIMAALVTLAFLVPVSPAVPTCGEARAQDGMMAAPGFDMTKPLTEADCVRLALERSYSILEAKDQLGLANATKLQAYGAMVPSLSAEYDISTGKRRSFDQDPPSLFSSEQALGSNSHGLSVNASQTLVSLPVLLNIAAQKKASNAARADVEAAEFAAAYGVRQQFYALVQAIKTADVRREDLNLAQEELRRTQNLFDVGSVARTDVLKSKVRVAEATSALTAGVNTVELERSRLAVALALPARTTLSVVTDMVPREATADSALAYASAMTARPELNAARLRLASAQDTRKAAKAELLPTIGHSYSMSRTRTTSDDLVDFQNGIPVYGKTKGSSTNWNYRIGLSWSILDRLVTQSNIQRAKYSESQYRHLLEQEELGVGLEVKAALVGLGNAASQVLSAREAVTSAEEDLKLSQERYNVGLGTILELIDARVALTRARTLEVQAMAAVKIAEAALDKATGRKSW